MFPQDITFTGLNALTGEPVIPPLTPAELYAALKSERVAQLKKGKLKQAVSRDNNLKHARDKGKLGLRAGYDPNDPSDAGWGLLYPQGTDPLVLEALSGLVKHRNGQLIEAPLEYVDDADGFRIKMKETAGDVDPNILPYYMLIVGSPGDANGLTFAFQHRLNDVRPVGRVAFDGPDGYADYASKVIEHETGAAPVRPRRALLFSPATDASTQNSAQYLAGNVQTYLSNLKVKLPDKQKAGYTVQAIGGFAAERQVLLDQLKSPPALLFTTSHGLSYPLTAGDEKEIARQKELMGALVCADWDGLAGPVSEQVCLAGAAIDDSFDLRGLVVFSFACYSAGAPKTERFAKFYKRLPEQIAPQDFVARLPQRLLQRGALAFIGHVDKTWGYSFYKAGIGADTKTFEDILGEILGGLTIGHAFERMPNKYLDLNSKLTNVEGLFKQLADEQIEQADLLSTWMARQDSRAYIILGDPAVCVHPERLQAVD
jgi:hypothetical protein